MKFLINIVLGLLLSRAVSAQILVDEGWGSSSRSRIRTDIQSFNSGMELKKTKKMGVGTTLAGATGLVGFNLDLNFTENFALSFGVGVSRGFQSFNLHMKQTLGGEGFLPYFVAGYSRWYSSGQEGGVENTSPAVMGKKFLNSSEKRSGEFAENIIYPGLGVQYINLHGDWQGLGYFAEVLLLVDIDDFLTGATGGIGTIYYF